VRCKEFKAEQRSRNAIASLLRAGPVEAETKSNGFRCQAARRAEVLLPLRHGCIRGGLGFAETHAHNSTQHNLAANQLGTPILAFFVPRESDHSVVVKKI